MTGTRVPAADDSTISEDLEDEGIHSKPWFVLRRAPSEFGGQCVRETEGMASKGSDFELKAYGGGVVTRSMLHKKPDEAVRPEVENQSPARRRKRTRMNKNDASASGGPNMDGIQFIGLPACLEGEPAECSQLRSQAFTEVWRSLQNSIQHAQEELCKSVFDDIRTWICSVHSCNEQDKLYGSTSTLVCPSLEAVNKQLHTGLLFLGGLDASDHRGTFDELAKYLRAAQCHVANLTPPDFLLRAGVAGPISSLLKQFVSIDPATADLEILAAYHREQPDNQGHPFVIMIESAESSKSAVLADLILALSEWIGELPIFLLMGIATTSDSLRKLLPASALERLKPHKFSLPSLFERFDAAIRGPFVETFCGFELGHRVAAFMRTYFLTHDLTVSFILRSLKVGCVEHFSSEPLSFLCLKLSDSESLVEFEKECANLPDVLLQYASRFPSIKSGSIPVEGGLISGKQIAMSLWELREQKKIRCMVLLCLHEAGKHYGQSFVDLFCEALRPPANQFCDIIRKVRNLAVPALTSLLDEWKKLTRHVKELYDEVVNLRFKVDGGIQQPKDALPTVNADLRLTRSQLKSMATMKHNRGSVGILVSDFLERMVGKYLVPLESLPLHEIVCFKGEELLKQALTGDIRGRIHFDLEQPWAWLQCECCMKDASYCENTPDACLAYCLAKEHMEHINVYDWYESFSSVTCSLHQATPSRKTKRGRTKESSSVSFPMSKAVIQAKFSKAVAELQLMGLVKVSNKKRPDFVRRATFGC